MSQDAEVLIPILAIGLPFVFGICWLASRTATTLFRTWCEARIKTRMIERGASVDEIERVLRAGSAGTAPQFRQPVPPIKAAQPYTH